MPQTSAPTFGDLLRKHRLAAGLTQEELAERAGLSVHGVQKLEQGLRTHIVTLSGGYCWRCSSRPPTWVSFRMQSNPTDATQLHLRGDLVMWVVTICPRNLHRS